MLFVMTDGSPTDTQIFEEALPKIQALRLGRTIGFAAGTKAKAEYLRMLTAEVICLDTLDSSSFEHMCEHVARTIQAFASHILPPTPAEILVAM